MKQEEFAQFAREIREALAGDPQLTFAIAGHTPLAYEVISLFREYDALERVTGIYDLPERSGGKVKAIEALRNDRPGAVVVASDESKEAILVAAVPYLPAEAKVIIGGFSHFAFRDDTYDAVLADCLVRSLATGYPYTLVHIYQCLVNASRLGLEGVVAEFGMFKGGTTMALAKFALALGRKWKVIGFDSFDGFPASRSCLDMYRHPDCVFRNPLDVKRYFAGHDVEIVAGDIVDTAKRLASEDVVLTFVDTDNFSSANAIIDVVQDRTLPGGAIVFDHFTGRDRHLRTIGERMAGKRLLSDSRYFHLHDTGVFFRQR